MFFDTKTRIKLIVSGVILIASGVFIYFNADKISNLH
jgi:hypothetical protein